MRISKALTVCCITGLITCASFPQMTVAQNASGTRDTPKPPKVVLIGDSIRLAYAPNVATKLEGKATVVSPEENSIDTPFTLKILEEWVIREKPAVVHWNCGLHDLKLDKKTGKFQVDIPTYQKNLREIVTRIRKETKAIQIFASITPVYDERHAKRGVEFDRKEADVKRYNAAALEVMRELNVPVDDLHWIVEKGDPEKLLGTDGVHYTPLRDDLLATAVADCVLRHLIVQAYQPLKEPAAGPKAAAEYRQTERQNDARVPEAFKKLAGQGGQFHIPKDAEEWKKERPEVLKIVRQSFGDLPPRPSPQKLRVVSREIRPNYTVEKIILDNGADGEITSLLLIPEKRQQPAPSILWLHASSRDCNELLAPGTNGGEEPLADAFMREGFVVFAPDAYWHGERSGTGPAGLTENGRAEQDTLFKFNLLMGRTLWGMFVRDDQIALDYFCTRPEVEKARIGATGMSMGGTRTWWLTAVDDRLATGVGIACLTRYRNLISHGQLRYHGVYFYVNGLLKHFDSEGMTSLIAPRPYLALTGELDAGQPSDGIKIIEEIVGQVYKVVGAPGQFKSVVYPETAHTYSPQMRKDMLEWMTRVLKTK